MTSHYIATLMQSLQCDSRPSATFHRRLQPLYTEKDNVSCSGILPNSTSPMQHSCGHYNAFCSITWQTRVYLRIWQQNITSIMRPRHCDLQPQMPKHIGTAHTRKRIQSSCMEATVTARQKKTSERVSPHPPHTRGTFHCQLQPLYTEKHKVSYSDTSPTRHSCSHYNAIHAAFVYNECVLHQHVSPCTTSLSHHPSSPPFVITLRQHSPPSRHHPSWSLPSVTTLRTFMLYYVILLFTDIKSLE